MLVSWAQRLARLSSIIHTDAVVDDEEQQGRVLDEYLTSREAKDRGLFMFLCVSTYKPNS